jgi:Domain of unknown function (DUF222)/HNH endonuclease
MCLPGQPPARPAPPAVPVPVTAADAVPVSAAGAVAMAQAALAFLANANMASVPAAAQADCLRGLERIESLHTAARAGTLAAFMASGGHEDDGQGSAGAWLRWQTRVTKGAAAGAVAWARRLAAHPAVGGALAAGGISASWAREICAWTGQLPAGRQADADAILLAAAAGGADLADLAGLAEEMQRRCAGPDPDDDGGFADRWLRLDLTLHRAGRVEGDLTPQCAAALQAVIEALGKKAGPEDTRSKGQRDHDAVEEACRRLAAAGCLPDRAGQSTQIQLHMTLDQLRGLEGAAGAEAAWAARGPAASPGSDCDASIVPVVSGHVDPAVLDRLAAALRGEPGSGQPPSGWPLSGVSPFGPGSPMGARVRRLILRHAADLLSGPAGLAAFLRTGLLPGPAGTPSLPLDVGKATEQIPGHLRRAVIARDRHCAFPGCRQRPAACQVHHIRPRGKGGSTSLGNLTLLCAFHHLIAVHRWGWQLTLHPDATVTAVSPDGHRTLHSHGPPARAA